MSITETETSGGSLIKSEELKPQASLSFGTSKSSLPKVTVDPTVSMQTISGFGVAMTQSSASLITGSKYESTVMNDLFGASGADFNIARVPMGASDFVTGKNYQGGKSFSYDDNAGKADPTLAKFSIGTPSKKATACTPASSSDEYGTGDYAATIPVLQCAKSKNPDLNLLAVPWSAPGWMKIDDPTVPTTCSGSDDFLKPADYSIYTDYFLKFLQGYQSAGLPVSEVSMQNEPENCSKTYPTMEMTAPDQATFAEDLYNELHAPVLGLSKIPTIMAYDHNYLDNSNPPWSAPKNQVTGYPEAVIKQSGESKSPVGLVGFHSYAGDLAQEKTALDTEHTTYPKAPIWMTEATGTNGSSTHAQNLVWEAQHDLMEPLQNWTSASLYLNPALESDGQPHTGGCGNCRGMITLNKGAEPALNEDYYDWAQFSKFVKPNATHICSTTLTLPSTVNGCTEAGPGAPTGGQNMIDTVAFQNQDGSTVLVAMNTTPDDPDLSGVKTVASDGDGYCALLSTGGVDCWGYNPDGELGNGTIGGPDGEGGYDTPQAVSGITNAVSVTGGDDEGYGYCALLSTGGVDCWGYNGDGEVGNGTIGGPDGEGGYDTPQAVSGITNAVSVTGDDDDGYCALLSTGGVDCWGYNPDGELGNGTIGGPDGEGGYDTPQAVSGITNAVSVTGGDDEGYGYCALLSTGGVDCWGYNGDGELGNGTIGGPDGEGGYDTPQAVSGITNAVSVTGGDDEGYGYCALLSTGGVDCWGYNGDGEVGNGTIGGPDGEGGYDTPQAVSGITNAVSVTGGDDEGYGYCALLSTGGVDCWGYNGDGEVGNGTIGGPDGEGGYDTPQAVTGITDAASVTGDDDGYCALLSTGGVDCWGYNPDGELGNGTTGGPDGEDGYDTPQAVTGITDAVSVTGDDEGGGYCALLSTGGVDCWGYNPDGELGNGTTGGPDGEDGYDTPQAVSSP